VVGRVAAPSWEVVVGDTMLPRPLVPSDSPPGGPAALVSDFAFRALFEHSPIGMALTGLDNVFLEVNGALGAMLGYAPGEMVGRSFADFTHPADLEVSLAAAAHALREPSPPLQVEKRYLHRDGRVIWVELSASLLRDRGGRPLHWVSQMVDVTERRRAVEELRQGEERLRLAVAHAPSPVVVHAEDGEILYLSDGWRRCSGYGAEELRTMRDWVDRAYGDLAEERLAQIRSLYARAVDSPEDVIHLETRIRAADGTTRIWDFSSAPIGQGADGRRLAISMAMDVTAQRAARQEADQSLAILRCVMETSPSAIFSIDRGHRYTSFNSVHATIMRALYQSEIRAGASILEAMTVAEDRRKAKANLDRALAGEVVIEEAHSGEAARDRRYFEVTHHPIRDAAGAVIGAAVFARDLTARRHAELALEEAVADLRRSNADLERFAYAASHDLQEPLRMVASFLQLLERRAGACLDAEGREFLGFAVGGATRMQVLVADLLAFSRAGRGDAPALTVATDLALDQALGNLGVAIQEAGAVVRRATLPPVLGAHSQVVQVFQNLVSNALKFHGGKAPVVEVDALDEGALRHFRVRDQGIGIDPQYFDRIFQLFQRLHGQERFEGTGIGLAITKRLVERLGGSIWVESAPGAGATFHFTLPAPPGGGDTR